MRRDEEGEAGKSTAGETYNLNFEPGGVRMIHRLQPMCPINFAYFAHFCG